MNRIAGDSGECGESDNTSVAAFDWGTIGDGGAACSAGLASRLKYGMIAARTASTARLCHRVLVSGVW